jgi:hypothetical protein
MLLASSMRLTAAFCTSTVSRGSSSRGMLGLRPGVARGQKHMLRMGAAAAASTGGKRKRG